MRSWHQPAGLARLQPSPTACSVQRRILAAPAGRQARLWRGGVVAAAPDEMAPPPAKPGDSAEQPPPASWLHSACAAVTRACSTPPGKVAVLQQVRLWLAGWALVLAQMHAEPSHSLAPTCLSCLVFTTTDHASPSGRSNQRRSTCNSMDCTEACTLIIRKQAKPLLAELPTPLLPLLCAGACHIWGSWDLPPSAAHRSPSAAHRSPSAGPAGPRPVNQPTGARVARGACSWSGGERELRKDNPRMPRVE